MRRQAYLGALIALLVSAPASAHTITPGTTGFTDGLAHPFGIASHVMLIVGMGLLLGQRDVATLRAPIYGWALALIAGLAIAPVVVSPELDLTNAQLALAGMAGALIAGARPYPTWLLLPLSILAGLSLGLDSAPDDATLQQTVAALAGTGIAAVFAFLNVAIFGNYLMAGAKARPWLAIGIRIVGSWLVAASVMVLALNLRGFAP